MFEQLLEDGPAQAQVQFVALSQQEIRHTHQGSVVSRSLREWDLLLTYCRRYQPTHALLMYFDIFQLGLLLGKKAPCAVSGIYFRPDFHYATTRGLKARLNVIRKEATLLAILARKRLTNLFCLDHSAITRIRAMNSRVNILPLPDPVKTYTISTDETEKLREALRIEPNRRVFLLFGHLDDRKGIEPLLAALNQVDPAIQRQVCVLLVGAIKPEYQVKIEQLMTTVSPSVQLIGVFKEVKGRSIQTYFELADYVLTLYQRHVGMASVIIRAAVSGKPLVSSDYGYLGHLVTSEQLGVVADSTSPTAISQLLEQVLTEGLPYSAVNLQKLADENSDVSFARTIFDHL
ncbi:hypothetical protein GCM10028773_34440 [Spirosoma koreense]